MPTMRAPVEDMSTMAPHSSRPPTWISMGIRERQRGAADSSKIFIGGASTGTSSPVTTLRALALRISGLTRLRAGPFGPFRALWRGVTLRLGRARPVALRLGRFDFFRSAMICSRAGPVGQVGNRRLALEALAGPAGRRYPARP